MKQVIPIFSASQEEVEDSIMRNLNKLGPHEKELKALINIEVQELVNSSMTGEMMDKRLSAIVSRLTEIVGPISACRKGCSHCCKMSVVLSSKEAEKIGEFIGVDPAKVQMSFETLDQKKLVETHCGTVCPFLKKNVCSIYEVRPYMCRTHFNVSDYPELCDIINHPGNSVPNFDFTAVWVAQVATYGFEVSYADIREFFPNGAEQSL